MTRIQSRADRVRHMAGRIRWYVREFTGESAYERYVAHARAHADAAAGAGAGVGTGTGTGVGAGAGDPAGGIMTRRAFERSRTDAREADPREGFRCC
ncbi:CstA-like transporter-associated (seleno)protein [Streptomyces sp. NPDC056987]|uniref:CstA-like transporter-associated (seleno)protein n=1 Tax=Streptomyces sp. NPDC056987 TaxID=3345988 RepID=UPI00363479D8